MSYRVFNIDNKKTRIYFNNRVPITPYTDFLLQHFPEVKDKFFLDFGFGSGVFSIWASLLGAKKIYAIDIRKEAETVLIDNIKRLNINNVNYTIRKNLHIVRGLDIVLSNPSSLPNDKTNIPKFLDGGYLGNKMILKLIRMSGAYLRKNGKCFFIHSSLVPRQFTIKEIANNNLNYKIIDEIRIPFRRIYDANLTHMLTLEKNYSDVIIERSRNRLYEVLYLFEVSKK